LIENQKNLNEIQIECYKYVLHKAIERSIIKKADTLQHLKISWSLEEEFLSYFANLRSLKMDVSLGPPYYDTNINWRHLEEASLPGLKVLEANIDTSRLNLDRLIKNINENLIVISIRYNCICEVNYNKRLIQAIYHNCPNLRYLSMPMKEHNIPEFEWLLIRCQNLNGLIIENDISFKYESLFEVLTRSSPISLYKFKFCFNRKFGSKFKALKSFFDNWKDRHPMLLQISLVNFSYEYEQEVEQLKDLVNKYKVNGIVQKCDFGWIHVFGEFEWNRKITDFYY
jgi:hypothetical protein